MQTRVAKWSHVLVACAIACAVAPATRAQEFLGLQVHGFGGWYYGRSNDLQFLGAKKGGNAETAQLA